MVTLFTVDPDNAAKCAVLLFTTAVSQPLSGKRNSAQKFRVALLLRDSLYFERTAPTLALSSPLLWILEIRFAKSFGRSLICLH